MRKELSMRKIFRIWWPLAISWLFMGTELPMVSAVMARLAEPKIHLAAYGGVVFPIALIIEAPVIMLLAGSTALSKDWASYLKMRKFMMWAGFLLTVLHFLLAFTPLYYPLVRGLMGVPEEIVEPARLGMMIMLPWTWSIAYRRFHQGVLIRFDHTKAVGVGTIIRLIANAITLTLSIMIGKAMGGLPGIIVGTCGIAVGVVVEAVYVGLRVRPVLRDELKPAPAVEPALTWRAFSDFYIPLAMTSLLLLLVQPLGSAALSRMPQALNSLAVWPVLNGMLFMMRSLGFAFNEVVVATMDEPGSVRSLRRFAGLIAGGVTAVGLLVAFTPLADFWFITVSGLPDELVTLARNGLWVALLWPAASVLQNWLQGTIVHGRKTRGITESVVVFLAVSAAALGWGANFSTITGLYVGLATFMLATLAQDVWLWVRSKPALAAAEARDAAFARAPAPGAD